MDDEVIRKSVSGSLSQIGSSNKFSKAVRVGNNQELIWATKKEWLTAEGCKRLIAHSVNAYNLMLFSKKTGRSGFKAGKTDSPEENDRYVTQSWAHINLVEEYDFSDGKDYKHLIWVRIWS